MAAYRNGMDEEKHFISYGLIFFLVDAIFFCGERLEVLDAVCLVLVDFKDFDVHFVI